MNKHFLSIQHVFLSVLFTAMLFATNLQATSIYYDEAPCLVLKKEKQAENAMLFLAGEDCCKNSKPKSATFRYTGQGCGATNTSQAAGKYACSDVSGGPNGAQQVFIVASDKVNGLGTIYFSGNVQIGNTFTASATDKLSSNTFFLIRASQGGPVLQTLQIHTSCSTPIVLGDQFGSLVLENVVFLDGSSCQPPAPPTDPCPEPVIQVSSGPYCAGEAVVFIAPELGFPCLSYAWDFGTSANPPVATGKGPHTVVFTQAGSRDVSLTIDNGCTNTSSSTGPVCPGDEDGPTTCFKIDPPVSGSSNGVTYTVTSQNGEPKLLTVTGNNIVSVNVKGGPVSVTYTTPPFTNLTAPINPNNGTPYGISHFTICLKDGSTIGSGQDCCKSNSGKPNTLVLVYNGKNCSATSTSQSTSKYSCQDVGSGPSGASSVFIIASEKENGLGAVYFSGTVNINTPFTVKTTGKYFSSNTYFTVRTSQSGTTLQRVKIHTSCSAPIVPGDQFGSLLLQGAAWSSGAFCGTGANPGSGGGGGADCCKSNSGKPNRLDLIYNGEGCASTNTSQSTSKYSCLDVGSGPSSSSSVYIIASSSDNGLGTVFFAGTVNINTAFTVSATSEFPSNTYFTIRKSQNGTVLQRVKIHTSCSAPIVPGDQFGSLVLQGAGWKSGAFCGSGSGNNGGGGKDCCDTNSGKPKQINLTYTGQGCSSTNTSQSTSKYSCQDVGSGPNSASTVYIVASSSDNGLGTVFFAGTVNINAAFTVSTTSSALPSNTFFTIRASQNGAVLQKVKIHTSCSAPLVPGEQFGSLVLNSATWANGATCGPATPSCVKCVRTTKLTLDIQNCAPLGAIGDFVWRDNNGNGLQDPGEPGIPAATVILSTCSGQTIDATFTDINGKYLFDSLPAGSYRLTFVNPNPLNLVFTNPNAGDDALDSDAEENGITACYTLPEGDTILTVDAGFKNLAPPCSINSQVTQITCLDNGTPTPTDDLFTFVLTVTGSNTGTGWSAIIGGTSVSGSYNTPVVLGPYPIAGGPLNFDIVDNQTATCNINQAVVPPPSCSQTLPARLGDFVWNDLNNNGIQDPNEPGVNNVTVQLKDCDNNILQTTTTNPTGFYEFTNLQPGCYQVGVVLPTGFVFSPVNQGLNGAIDSDIDPATAMTGEVNLAPGENNPTLDAGLFASPPQPARLGDFVWNDLNNNGIQDPNEPGVNNVTVQLKDCNNNILQTTTTNPTGFYEFTNLQPGCYQVGVVLPTGFVFSPVNQGLNGAIDSDIDPATAMTGDVNLAPGDNNPTLDAGLFKPVNQKAKIGDFVWFDTNNNGIQNPGEPGIPGVIVFLDKCDGGNVAFTTTDANGMYMFNDVEPGQYRVKFANPGSFNNVQVVFTLQNAGDNDETDSDADWLGLTDCFTVNPGDINLTIDAGLRAKTTTPVCDNVTNGGKIGFDESNCQAYDPANIVSLSLPSGGTGQIEYVWLSSTLGCPDNNSQAIPNSNSPTFDPGPISQTTWYLRCARRVGCTQYIESNCIKKEVANCGPGSCTATVSVSTGKITINGLTAPLVAVQVFNANYTATVFSCFNNCNNPQVISVAPGTYHVKVNLWGTGGVKICEVFETVNVPSQFAGSGTGSLGAPTGNGNDAVQMNHEDRITPGSLEVYPNPASGSATVRWNSEADWQNATIAVYNQLGQQVRMVKIGTASTGSYQLDLSEMNDGQYVIHFLAEGQTPVVKKLMVKR